MLLEIKVPSVGESVTEATLGQWYKKDGDLIQKDEPLFVIETDKVTLEVVAEADGILSIKVEARETVAIGEVVDDAVMGSIEFAAAGLEIPLIVVLGHSSCGMIKACAQRIEVKGCLLKMVWEVQPAVDQARDQGGDLVDHGARANARMIAEKLGSSGTVLVKPRLVKPGTPSQSSPLISL